MEQSHDDTSLGSQHLQNKEKRRKNSIRYMFRTAKNMERQGRWGEALTLLERILQRDPQDAHSHLALARLEARREGKGKNHDKHREKYDNNEKSKARLAFQKGTAACPESVHLWQGWAVYEQSQGNMDRARELFEEALALEPFNPYVCHAYSLMEKKLGDEERAVELLERALSAKDTDVTAALVCTLGESFVAAGKLKEARELYTTHLPALKTEKDQVEVCLAAAWLEERSFRKPDRAHELLTRALAISPTSSLARVAMARLEGRLQAAKESSVDGSGDTRKQYLARQNTSFTASKATAKRLQAICNELHRKGMENKRARSKQQQIANKQSGVRASSSEDGRVFNALATLEIQQRRYEAARDVLRNGLDLYPFDYNLYTAAGKVEELLGNTTAARQFYSESLRLEPSAPTLVAFALLELNNPQQQTDTTPQANFTLVKGLFEEALLLDPRNGPAYNAYGNAEARRGNIEEARSIFERGVQANCSDAASIYHGYGMLEISCGNLEKARGILHQGLESVRQHQDLIFSDLPRRERAKFLSHTLGMLELNSNRPTIALEIFRDGIERCGNSSRLLLGSALCEMRLGKEEAARNLFQRSVLIDKRHAQAWQAWGVMETRAGNFKKASTIFQRGIKNAPGHAALWHGYAALEVKRGNVMNARTLYAAGLKKAQRRQFALFQGWATLELREGNLQAARKLISESLTKNKKNGRGWVIAAQIEEQDGHTGLVSLLLRRGIECNPNDAELYRELGEYLVGQGKINDAREVFEEGMDRNAMYAPLFHSLAELEARICNVDGLARLNKRAAQLFNRNALEPAPLSSVALGTKIKAKRTRGDSHHHGHAFATKIVENDVDEEMIQGLLGAGVDALSLLESLNGDGLVDDMMSIESMVSDDTTTNMN
jgi:Tfp pilus assembly protein PilF